MPTITRNFTPPMKAANGCKYYAAKVAAGGFTGIDAEINRAAVAARAYYRAARVASASGDNDATPAVVAARNAAINNRKAYRLAGK